MYVMCKLMGQYVQVERHTSNGRMDIVVQTDKCVYIIELKMDASADEALQQIEEKGYAKPFAADPRKLFSHYCFCIGRKEFGMSGSIQNQVGIPEKC